MRPITVGIHLIFLLDFCICLITLNYVAYHHYYLFSACDLWIKGGIDIIFCQ